MDSLDVIETLWGTGISSHGGSPIPPPSILRSAPVGYFQGVDESFLANVGPRLIAKSNPFTPAGEGGEAIFYYAHITATWSASAMLLVQAVVDDIASGLDTARAVGWTYSPSFVYLPMQSQAIDGVRKSQSFAVPLMRSAVDGYGPVLTFSTPTEELRNHLRGKRIAITISTAGRTGAGDLAIEGAEIEWEAIRKGSYPALDGGPFFGITPVPVRP